MNKNYLFKFYIMLAAFVMSLTACTDYDNNYDERKLAYEEAFKDVFGNIDPNQDWNMAKQVKANLDLTGISNECTVTIYDKAPIRNGAAILYSATANGGSNTSFCFDSPKSLNDVYVKITDTKKINLTSEYLKINSNTLNIKPRLLGGAPTHPTTLGTPLEDDFVGVIQDNHNHWPLLQVNEWDNRVNYNQLYKTYPLVGVETTDGGSVMISDIDEIVGKGGVFNERNNQRTECNLSKWYKDLDAEKGAEYILATDGPVEFDIMYGGTVKQNQIGYFYYPDGMSYEEAIRRPHYIIGSCRPQDNVKINDIPMATGEGMKLPGLVDSYDATGADVKLTGTHYKLTYFGESGTDEANASYTFKAGTHVVFFMVQNGLNVENSYGFNIENSVPAFNALEEKYWLDNADDHSVNRWVHTDDKATCPQLTGELDAVTYRWGGMTILGFEDRDEDDMNDILFFVQGNFRNEIKELKEETDVYEWVVACEDLGSSDISDIDFNDVVYGVKHYTSKKTMYSKYYDEHGNLVSTGLPKIIDKANYLVVTPKAAGGTLKSHIFYDERDLGEVHSLLDPNTNYGSVLSGEMPMLNTRSLSYTGTPVIIELGDDEEFTMANIEDGVTSAAKFSVVVAQDETNKERNSGEGTAVKITKPIEGATPQMLILPIGWDWPTERTSIGTAYPNFAEWANDADKYGWIKTCNGPVIKNPVKTYEDNTSGGSTGGGGGSTITPSGTTTYTGDALAALLDNGTYVIPASACQTKTSCTVTFQFTPSGDYVQMDAWTPGDNDWTWLQLFNGQSATQMQMTGMVADTDYPHTVKSDVFKYINKNGMKFKIDFGTITSIKIVAE